MKRWLLTYVVCWLRGHVDGCDGVFSASNTSTHVTASSLGQWRLSTA